MRHLMIWAVAGVVCLGAALQCAASEWNFYGSARVGTFYRSVETGGVKAKNYTQSLQNNARIGANVKAGDTLAGRFEYGSSGGNANIRHLYGEWTFGPGKLLVGQTDTPLNFALSKQVINSDHNLNSYGHVDGQRKPMVRLAFGDFMIAAVQPESSDLKLGAAGTRESKIPKIEAKYKFSWDRAFLELAGGYQTYELTNTGNNRQYDVQSYVLAAGGQLKAGAFYFNANAWVGQNVGPYAYNFAPDGDPDLTGTTLTDSDAWGMLVAVGYTLNEMFSFEVGYGHVQSQLEQFVALKSGKDKAESYYLQSTITLAPGVSVVPEIGRLDGMNNSAGARESDTVYAGAKWQIDF